VSRPPAPTNGGINIGGSDQSFNDDEDLSDGVEELGRNGGHSVRQRTRAYWSDENNACLLELAMEQRRAGTYTGSEMTAERY
jgi:hypothetical protein